jgi:hypothetical protein
VLPDVDAEQRHVVLHQRTVLVRRRVQREAGAVPDEPRPARAEPLDAVVVHRRLQLVGVAPEVVDRGGEVSRRLSASTWLHDLPEERMVRVPAAVVADRGLLVFGHGVEQRSEQLLDRVAVELGAFDRLVQVVDVGLVVLPVVDLHRLLADRRLERVVVVGKRGELVGHWRFSFGWFLLWRICSAPHPLSLKERYGACL